MSNSINNNIPFVPENTIDPAAGLNESINTIDVLLQLAVESVGSNTPPGSPTEGQRFAVGTSPTGAWAGQANKIARYLDTIWRFYNAHSCINIADGKLYRRTTGAWSETGTFLGGTLTGAINEAPPVTLPSAATVNIGAAAANTINITGTTTITAFDTIAAGATRRLVFGGALTLTHNATSLILPGGASITTAAGDAAEFVSLGSGNWRCYNYERANGTSVALGPGSSPTFVALTLSNGQVVFPSVQVPSANANTLDDYEEGTFTPTITFATPGNLSVSYATQIGMYTKVGRMCALNFTVTTSAFTHTTASGALTVAGLPFSGIGGSTATAALRFQGITKAGFSDFTALVAGSVSVATFVAGNSGAGFSTVVAADCPTGGVLSLTAALVIHTP